MTEIEQAKNEAWCLADLDELAKMKCAQLGLSELFLHGEGEASNSAEELRQRRAEFQPHLEEWQRSFQDFTAELFDRCAWQTVLYQYTRRGILVSVIKPEISNHMFRSLRTAKVWNKRRLKSGKA